MELQVNGPLSPTQQTRIRVLQLDHFSSPNVTQDTVTWHHSWDGTGSTCQDRCGAPWSQLGKNTQFSAVCKFTGVALFDALGGNVPIGLVESAWGGTRIESWSSPDALSSCPADTTAGCGPPIGGQWARMNSTNSGNLCSAAWNGMLHPILNMRFAAMLWYQVRNSTVVYVVFDFNSRRHPRFSFRENPTLIALREHGRDLETTLAELVPR